MHLRDRFPGKETSTMRSKVFEFVYSTAVVKVIPTLVYTRASISYCKFGTMVDTKYMSGLLRLSGIVKPHRVAGTS